MSETALLLTYCLGGVLTFLVVHFRRWRVVLAMLFGTVASLGVYVLASAAAGARLYDPWLGAALFINGFFALTAAAAGAIVAHVIRDIAEGR